METRILLENITRIVHENENLKAEVAEKASKIEYQNTKIGELLQQSQK